jgi:hypothetical protein
MSWTFTGLSSDTYYKIKVIPKIGTAFENDNCSVTQRTLGCASDYTLAPDGSYCYKIDETSPTPPDGDFSSSVTMRMSYTSYSAAGSYIYNPGFNVNGSGTSNLIPLSNPFWVNGPGDGGDHTETDGPLNRSGVWSDITMDDQYIGFSVCLNLAASSTYYIGLGGDNRCKVVIDSVVIVDQDLDALGAQYGYGPSSAFKIWHIYPVALTAGPHIIEVYGYNISGVAAMGAEIYNNTAAEIIAATSYSDLNLVFSTKDRDGQPMQLGNLSIGYTCPDGYSLAACEDPYVCRRILTTTPT